MIFLVALVHVGMLGLLAIVVGSLIRLHAAALCSRREVALLVAVGMEAGGRDERAERVADRALRLWRVVPGIPLLYAGLALGHLGLPGGVWYDVALASAAWGLCWWASRNLVREAHDPALPLALLALLGLHVGLLTEVSRAWTVNGQPNTGWLSSTALLLVVGALAPGAILRAKSKAPGLTPPWFYALSGRDGVRLGLALFGAGALLALWQHVTHTPRPVYACAMAAYLLAGTTGVARCAARSFRHGTLTGLLSRWWPGLALCGINILLPIATADFSPAVVLLVTLTVLLWVARERGMAVLLGAVMVLGLLGVSRSGLVPRFQERWSLMAQPYAGGSSQMAQTLYAVARGGVFGVGPGRMARINAVVKGRQVIRPAVPLAETDAVLTTLAETTGMVGIGAVLALFAVITSGLMEAARRADRLWTRLYLTQTGVLFFVAAVWGAGWSVGDVAPMAGLAVPLLTRGWGAMGLWLPVLCLAVVLADMDEPSETPLLPVSPARSWVLARMATTGLLLLTLLAGLRTATIDRDRRLTAVFHDTKREAKIAEWIARGQVRCSSDGSLVASGGSASDRRKITADVRRHLIRAARSPRVGWEPVPAREDLVEVEPSGLGAALRSAQE